MNLQTSNNFLMLAKDQDIIKNKTIIRAISVSLLILFMILGAYASIRLPFYPIPITLQTLIVLTGAILLGRNLSSLAQGIYLGLGVIGIPVFTSFGSGILWFAGPTGGYLIGFVLASFIVGILRTDKVFHSTFVMISLLLIGESILFTCGMLHLFMFYNYTIKNVILIGLVPFIPGEILKLSIAVGLIKTLKNSHFIKYIN